MSVAISPTRISFGSLGFFSRLFRQYCDGYEALAPFFSFDYREPEGRVNAASAAAKHERDRTQLVEVLHRQNRRWGNDERAFDNIERLRDPRSVAVVTGQQVALFTGPLYTVLKTITVLQMAERLESESGRPVVPVFWLEGDDHDFAEVSSVAILADNEPTRLSYEGHSTPAEGNLGPVGRIAFTDQIAEVVGRLNGLLPETEFKSSLLEAVGTAYAPGATFLDAFAILMRRTFWDSGLVFISPDEPQLKHMVAPLFRRELEDTYEVARRVGAVSQRLKPEYHAQVTVRPSNLFVVDATGRHALDAEDGRFVVRGGNGRLTKEEALARVAASPETFSANVVLRPLVQDTLLPTALYVAGPSEIAYFAQFKPVYEWAGIPMPAVYPRASATIVETRIRKVLDDLPVTLADLDEDLEPLFQRVVRERIDTDVDIHFGTATRHIHEAINTLKPVLQDVDPTLIKSAESTRTALLKEFERLQHRVLKAEKRKHEQVRDRLGRAKANLFPFGRPQERSISILYFLNKYGPDFPALLKEAISEDTCFHQVLEI